MTAQPSTFFAMLARIQAQGAFRSFGVPQELFPHYDRVVPINDYLLSYAGNEPGLPLRRLHELIIQHAAGPPPGAIPQGLTDLATALEPAQRPLLDGYPRFAVQYLGRDIAVHTEAGDHPVALFWSHAYVSKVRRNPPPDAVYAYVERIDNNGALRNWAQHQENPDLLNRVTGDPNLHNVFSTAGALAQWSLATDKAVCYLYQTGAFDAGAVLSAADVAQAVPAVHPETRRHAGRVAAYAVARQDDAPIIRLRINASQAAFDGKPFLLTANELHYIWNTDELDALAGLSPESPDYPAARLRLTLDLNGPKRPPQEDA